MSRPLLISDCDEVLLHISPVVLGDGVRLFEDLGDRLPALEIAETIPAPDVTHVRYRVVK